MTIYDGADAPYWNGLTEGRLVLPQCACGDWLWPAVSQCGTCGSADIQWREQAMRGTIFSWTRTWHRFGFTENIDLPFISIVASVEGCGIRLLGRLDDPDQIDPVIGENVSGRIGATRVGERDIPTIIWRRG